MKEALHEFDIQKIDEALLSSINIKTIKRRLGTKKKSNVSKKGSEAKAK